MKTDFNTDFDELKIYTSDNSARAGLLQTATAILNGDVDAPRPSYFPAARLIDRLVASRRYVLGLKERIKVGVVFAMWQEAKRVLPQSHENINGEDCVNDKLRSLYWLFEGTAVDWHLYGVDDNCPQNSGDVAREQIKNSPHMHRVSIDKLADEYPFSELPLSRMMSPTDSTKGGAIIFGMQKAIREGCDYVCYTDCDNSVQVGELGLLLAEVIGNGYTAAFGSSSFDESDSFWHPLRGDGTPSARIFNHLRRAIFGFQPQSFLLAEPFKLFEAQYLRDSLRRVEAFDFSFDAWLVLGLVADNRPLKLIPYSFFDSFEESSWHHKGDADVEFQKLLGLARTLRTLKLPINEALVQLIETRFSSRADVERLLNTPPPAQLVDPQAPLGSEDLMTSDQVIAFVDSALETSSTKGDGLS